MNRPELCRTDGASTAPLLAAGAGDNAATARVMAATAAMLDVDLATLDSLALAAHSDAGGLTFLPYLDGERSPNLPHATGPDSPEAT